VRVAPQRRAILDRQQGRDVVGGRDEGDGARERVAVPGAERTLAEKHLALRHRQQAGQGLHQRGLARGVGADQGQGLAGVQRQVHAVQDGARATRHDERASFEQRAHARVPPCRSATRK
jgi:hypothetical protein